MLWPKNVEKCINEEFYSSYSSFITIRVTRSRRVGLAVYIARIRGCRNPQGFLVGKCDWERSFGKATISATVILK
jgi:hypothetical protein